MFKYSRRASGDHKLRNDSILSKHADLCYDSKVSGPLVPIDPSLYCDLLVL